MATRADFAKALLNRLGIPVSQNRIVGLVAFAAIEDGHWGNVNPHLKGTRNPFNTTLPMPGSRRLPGFAANIQGYKDWPQGIEATARTMAQGNMRAMIDALKHDVSGQEFLTAVTNTAWCPGCDYTPFNAQALYNAKANVQDSGGTNIASGGGPNWPWILGIAAVIALGIGGLWYWRTGTFFGLGKGSGHTIARLLGAGENPVGVGAGSSKMKSKRSSRVQTLIFSRSKYSEAQAKRWAKNHGYRAGKVDVTDKSIRLRQRAPGGRMRTVTFGKGIKAVVSFAQ